MRIATALTVLFCLTASALAEPPETFLTKWTEARKAAAKQKKPLYIHFTEQSCTWCRKIEKETYPNEAVKKALGEFICVTLDCTEPENGPTPDDVKVNMALFEKLGGKGYPFLVMVSSDGVVLNSIEGFVPAETLVKDFAAAKAAYKEYQTFTAYAGNPKTDKDGYDFNLKAMVFYQKYRHSEHVLSAAEKILELDPENKKGDHVLAKLVQLQFSLAGPDKTEPLMEDVCKLDPLNEKSAYEKAILLQIYNEYSAFRQNRRDAPDEAKAYLEQIVKRAEKARGIEHRLKDPAKLYYMASQACLQMLQFDKAVDWTQRALAASKDKEESKMLKERIEDIRALKKKLDSTSEPAKDSGK
jgi:thioredoxin-related protein